MDKTTDDTPTEVTSPEVPVSLADDQHLSNGRQSSSGVSIKTECAVSRSMGAFDDQTFSFAAMLKESFSTTDDAFRNSHFYAGVSDKTENASGKDCVSESEKPVSIVDFLNKSQSSSVNTKALTSTSSCSMDISTIEEMISLVNDMVERSKSTSGLDRKNKISMSPEQLKQPPRKKTKLSRSMQVPVKDLLDGIHTSLCKRDCNFKHNALVLAICVPDDHELKDYLENHWKRVMTNCWKSAQYSIDPKLMTQLVHLTVLFGKYNLLKCLLRVHVDCSGLYVDSAQNSPLHTILKCTHYYMPSSSHQEKLVAFQRILHLLAKYNCNIVLVRDRPNEDTILHVCAKKIKELTNQIQSIQSHGHDELKLQGLLNQRQLLEGIFKEVIHTLKRLSADGSLQHNQVTELFDCANNAGEMMSQILKEDESARNNCGVLASQVASTLHQEGNTVCTKQQKIVAEENLENVMTEENISQLSTVARSSGSCTAQNENTHVLTQAANPSGTEAFCTNHHSVVTTESPSMRTTQIVTSTQIENSTGTITLSTNCPSVQVATGCPSQSSSTTESTSLWPEQTVENSIETTILSTECQSAQTPNGSPKQSLSTTESALLCPAQTVLASQAANSIQVTILSTECQSVQAPNACPKQPTSTTVSGSVRLPQTVVSTEVANPLGSTTLLTDCSFGHTPSGCLKQSISNVSAAPITVPSKTLDSGAQAMQTMPVNTGRQLSGKHTFLCSQDCTLKHHKLVELLCATPDHLNTDTATVEAESCADLKDYLEKSHWVIPEVVPALEPSLRLPIVHLACFLGKHKALEVLSDFGFHALLRTANTEETPLHMTVQLLHYQTSNSIFLSDVVVNIVKTLNQHCHPISLFSAKDAKGNSVLHAMAKLISSNVPVAATLLYVYLFRVFVHFILKERQCIPKSGSLQILSNCLKDCNKAGQNVESLLQESIHGEQLLEYLNGLMQKGRPEMSSKTIVEGRKDSHGHPEGQHVTCTDQKHAGTQREMSKEPKNLVDFILSADCKISSASKKRIVDCYIGEYESRLQLVRAKMATVRQEMASAKTLLERNMIVGAKLRMMESEVSWNAKRMKLREGELKKKQREQVLLHKRLLLLEGLQNIVNER